MDTTAQVLASDTPDPTPVAARPTGVAPAGNPLPWLVDRALIGDLLVEFARSLDDKDWAAHIALYLPDGSFTAGDVLHLHGHDQLWGTASRRGLGRYAGTWHLSSNHAIHIDGDTARTRSYLIGVHLPGEDPTHHADGGGWYDCTLHRTPEGWRFATVVITEKWRNAVSLSHIDEDPIDRV